MARPKKKGLSYFPFDVDFFGDPKIFRLCNKYGPRGVMIYQVSLCFIYRNGYYLECAADDLSAMIAKEIGTKWINSLDLVCDVIRFCGELELFDDALLAQGVVTSRGIQERYSEATVRNRVDKSKYWLLDTELEEKDSVPLIPVPENSVSATKTPVSATKTPVSDAKMQQRKGKESKLNERKREYAPHVLATDSEYDELLNLYGKEKLTAMIDILSNYKALKGVKYESDYAALKSWVSDAYEERMAKRRMNQMKSDNHSYNLEDFEKLAIGGE